MYISVLNLGRWSWTKLSAGKCPQKNMLTHLWRMWKKGLQRKGCVCPQSVIRRCLPTTDPSTRWVPSLIVKAFKCIKNLLVCCDGQSSLGELTYCWKPLWCLLIWRRRVRDTYNNYTGFLGIWNRTQRGRLRSTHSIHTSASECSNTMTGMTFIVMPLKQFPGHAGAEREPDDNTLLRRHKPWQRSCHEAIANGNLDIL